MRVATNSCPVTRNVNNMLNVIGDSMPSQGARDNAGTIGRIPTALAIHRMRGRAGERTRPQALPRRLTPGKKFLLILQISICVGSRVLAGSGSRSLNLGPDFFD